MLNTGKLNYHVQGSDLEVHDAKSVAHLLLTNAGGFLLADRPEDVGQGFVHPRHVLVVQVVDVDGFLLMEKYM